jgi:hypothetical protein
LAPPTPNLPQWGANRPTLLYVRPGVDNPDGIGPPPPAPRTAFNPFHGRPPLPTTATTTTTTTATTAVTTFDRRMSPACRRAETMSAGITAISITDLSEPTQRLETSRYFPGVHGEDAGPSRGHRRGEDHDMTMD